MGYEELSLSGFIDEAGSVSNRHHLRRFCFVLGAGASITSGIKTVANWLIYVIKN